MQNRTTQQNRALHKFFRLLSDKLNEQGLEMPHVIKTSIWWTPESVKQYLWKPLQQKKYGKSSTTELNKIEEIDEIHTQLMQILGERCSVEYIPFPHEEHTNLAINASDKVRMK